MVQICRYFFFFLKMPKIWVGWMTLNGEKKEDGLNDYVSILANNIPANFF